MKNISDEKIHQDIYKWVQNFVSKPNPKLNGNAPCPFALDSLKRNNVLITINQTNSIEETNHLINDACQKVLNNDFEVAVVVHPSYKDWKAQDVSTFVQNWRKEHIEEDLYLLKDHPLSKEMVSGVSMNQGDYLLFFVQRKSTLLAARKELRKQGYYESWSQSEQERVFGSLKINDKS